MGLTSKDYTDFVLLWIQKRTGVHPGELLVYPAMVRHCLCCQASATYAHRTNGLCLQCCDEQVCLLCSAAFVPSQESVGTVCPACWAGLEKTWTTLYQEDPARAESEVRSAILKRRPVLSGCRHQR